MAFFAAISLLASPAAITTASAHGGDKGLVHACVGRDKLVRAVGPSKRCKQFGKAIHWEIEEPNPLSGLTVVDATGRPVGQTIEVGAHAATVLLAVGGKELTYGVEPEGFGYVDEVPGSLETSSLPIDSPYFIYADSLDCSGTRYIENYTFEQTFAPIAYVSLSRESNGALKLFTADPQTPPRVLSEGAVYSEFITDGPDGLDNEADVCIQRTIEPGDGQKQLIAVQLLGDLNSFGFVPPFRLQ